MPRLTSELLTRAIRIFAEHAYPEGAIPDNRQGIIRSSADDPLPSLLSQKGVEVNRDPAHVECVRYLLRVGNAWYPHMKILASVLGPDEEVIFSVDTHDQLSLPPGSNEAEQFAELRARNLELARRVERAWERNDVPTQASTLRAYLARGASPPGRA